MSPSSTRVWAAAQEQLRQALDLVDDDDGVAGSELMGRFCGHLKQGRSKDAALRAAQVEMIRQGSSSHPNRRAAFQLSGDWK